jgi:hypothetical protein
VKELLIALLLGRRPSERTSMIPMDHASLCLDCEFIVHAKHSRCPHCDSKALANVGRILNRKTSAKVIHIQSWSFAPRRKAAGL